MTGPAIPPPTFRVVLALGVAVVAAMALAWAGLAALASARSDRAALASQARQGALAPAPLLGEGLAFGADRTAATGALLDGLRRAAAARRLLVERLAGLPPVEGAPAELAAELVVSGPEADVFSFVHSVETARPAIRFASWRVMRTGPGETAIRLEARAVGYRELS